MPDCPKCGTKLIKHTTVKIRNDTNIEIIGHHFFCPNMKEPICNYEEDIPGKPRREPKEKKEYPKKYNKPRYHQRRS